MKVLRIGAGPKNMLPNYNSASGIVRMSNLNIDSLWADLVNERAINFAGVRNHNPCDIFALINNMYRQITEQHVSLKNILRKLDDKTMQQSNVSSVTDSGGTPARQ